MKKYILFDNDGVLVETENWYFETNKKALKELGLTYELSINLLSYSKVIAAEGQYILSTTVNKSHSFKA